MERFDQEGAPPNNRRNENNSDEGIDRRRFLKLLGLGAAAAATGSVFEGKKEAAAEEIPRKGFQIVDGRAVLWTFDAKGDVESYAIVGSVEDLGLKNEATDVMLSREVVRAAESLVDAGSRCRQGDTEACRSVGLAQVDLREAIQVNKELLVGKRPKIPSRMPVFKPPPPTTSL